MSRCNKKGTKAKTKRQKEEFYSPAMTAANSNGVPRHNAIFAVMNAEEEAA